MEANLKLKHEILNIVKSDNGCYVSFDYKSDDGKQTVRAFTVNPNRGNIPFLLKEATADTQEEALKQILDYLKRKSDMSSFTITWNEANSSTPIKKSYFYCHDALEAIQKFFVDKNVVDFIIYEVRLNPIA